VLLDHRMTQTNQNKENTQNKDIHYLKNKNLPYVKTSSMDRFSFFFFFQLFIFQSPNMEIFRDKKIAS